MRLLFHLCSIVFWSVFPYFVDLYNIFFNNVSLLKYTKLLHHSTLSPVHHIVVGVCWGCVCVCVCGVFRCEQVGCVFVCVGGCVCRGVFVAFKQNSVHFVKANC